MSAKLSIADIVETLTDRPLPLRLTAYDGSATGAEDASVGLHVRSARGVAYLASAPGDLGMARAYVTGELELRGVHPGDPYDVLAVLRDGIRTRRPTAAEAVQIVRSLGLERLRPPPVPAAETMPRWRRVIEGLTHSRTRDARAVSHHYDVSNRFYELVLGPSMAYTCAVFRKESASIEEAQAEKFDLVARKLGLSRGMRLLDVGCGWGGMVMHAAREYGVHALGVTLSSQQAQWASAAIEREGLSRLAQVRHLDYRDVPVVTFDAVSSIGLLEHVGVRHYHDYFTLLRSRLRPGGRLLNHCITRPTNQPLSTGPFIDRYIFPDGELTGSGRIVTEAQDAGFEVRHTEDLREHYALTLRRWCDNLVAHWDECVAEVGEPTARMWGMYLAGSRLGFEANVVQLHQVLAVRVAEDGAAAFPLRPDWGSA